MFQQFSLLVKERDSQTVVFSSSEVAGNNVTFFVTEGARFSFSKATGILSARGPLLRSLVLLVSTASNDDGGDEEEVAYSVSVSYSMSRQNDPLFSVQQNEWVIHGWSKCSRECGGGSQQVLLK